MDLVMKLLSKIESSTLVIVCLIEIILLFLLIRFIICHRKNIKGLFDNWIKHQNKKHELLTIIYDSQKKIDALTENRIHDREQSFAIQKQLTDAIADISSKLNDMESRSNKRIRAELKDKISQQYRYYHRLYRWNSMEKESLMGLIEEYEAAGGTNSFVHDIVLPESYLWDMVDDEH